MPSALSPPAQDTTSPPPPPPPPPPPSGKLASVDTATLRRQLAPVTLAAGAAGATFTNWGLSFTCRPEATFVPRDEGECALVLELARREGKRVRAAGVGHSPSDVACTREYMVRTDRLDKVVQVSVPCLSRAM